MKIRHIFYWILVSMAPKRTCMSWVKVPFWLQEIGEDFTLWQFILTPSPAQDIRHARTLLAFSLEFLLSIITEYVDINFLWKQCKIWLIHLLSSIPSFARSTRGRWRCKVFVTRFLPSKVMSGVPQCHACGARDVIVLISLVPFKSAVSRQQAQLTTTRRWRHDATKTSLGQNLFHVSSLKCISIWLYYSTADKPV